VKFAGDATALVVLQRDEPSEQVTVVKAEILQGRGKPVRLLAELLDSGGPTSGMTAS
jgi:hypothetical protein